jgi:hypothetical protein
MDRDNLAEEFARQAALILETRERLSQDAISTFVHQCQRWMTVYRIQRHRELNPSPERQAFHAWHDTALGKLDRLLSWIDQDPISPPRRADPAGDLLEQLAYERETFRRGVEQFQDWLKSAYDSSRMNHRPVDWVRADLEENIGVALCRAGVIPTKARAGTYARLLEQAHAAVELNPVDVHRSVRQACDRHPEWRTAATVPEHM